MRMPLGPQPTEPPFQSTLHSWASLEISFPLCSAVEKENYWAGPSVVNLSCSVLRGRGVGKCFPALLRVVSPRNRLSLRRRAHRLHLRAEHARVFATMYRTAWGCPPAHAGLWGQPEPSRWKARNRVRPTVNILQTASHQTHWPLYPTVSQVTW